LVRHNPDIAILINNDFNISAGLLDSAQTQHIDQGLRPLFYSIRLRAGFLWEFSIA